MSNSIIDRQRELLANLENPEGNPPIDGSQGGKVPGAPPQGLPQSVPGQEPPAGGAPGADPNAQPISTTPQPAAGTAGNEDLKQQINVLAGQVEEYKSLYNRQHGMVAPLQRQTAELQRTNAELTRQVEDLKQLATKPGAAPTPQAPQASTTPQAEAEDPNLSEFLNLYSEMVPGLKAFVQQALGSAIGNTVQQVQPAIELAKKAERDGVLATHLAPLYARHPQAGNIIRSPQFAQWVEQQPPYIKDSILEKVTAPEHFPVGQIVSIFDEFVRATTPPPQQPQSPSAQPSPGEMAVDVRRVPTSSTPGGTPLPQPLTRDRLTKINRALTVERSLYSEAEIAAFKAELAAGEAVSNAAGYGLAPRLETLTR